MSRHLSWLHEVGENVVDLFSSWIRQVEVVVFSNVILVFVLILKLLCEAVITHRRADFCTDIKLHLIDTEASRGKIPRRAESDFVLSKSSS